MVLGLVAPQADISLLMPSVSESRDNIGGDYDMSLASYYGYSATGGIGGGSLLPGNSCSTSIYSMGDLKKDANQDDDCKNSLSTTPPATLTMNSEATTPTGVGHQDSSLSASPEQYNSLGALLPPDQITSAPVSPNKCTPKAPSGQSAKNPPALPPRGNFSSLQAAATNSTSVIDSTLTDTTCSSVPSFVDSTGTPTKQQQPPAIHFSSPNDVSISGARSGQLFSSTKLTNKKTSQAGSVNLTSSLTNMMSQLDTSIRGSPSSSQQSLVDNDDSLSCKSDDSGDSEAFVVINRGAGGPNSLLGGLDDSVDATLFAINSKVTSPIEFGSVEFAAEVHEDVNFGCNTAPSRMPMHLGTSVTDGNIDRARSTEPRKPNGLYDHYRWLFVLLYLTR